MKGERPMDILKSKVRYFPFPPPQEWEQGNDQYDECKLNLLWLLCAEIDELHGRRWEGNLYSKDIDRYRTKDLRALLQLAPLAFVRAFMRLEGGEPVLAHGWPAVWRETMWRRARQAHQRLDGGCERKVIVVDFRKGRVSA